MSAARPSPPPGPSAPPGPPASPPPARSRPPPTAPRRPPPELPARRGNVSTLIGPSGPLGLNVSTGGSVVARPAAAEQGIRPILSRTGQAPDGDVHRNRRTSPTETPDQQLGLRHRSHHPLVKARRHEPVTASNVTQGRRPIPARPGRRPAGRA